MLTGDIGPVHVDELLLGPEVAARPDADVQRDLYRAFVLDSLAPMTVNARVRDGIVTLNGTVASEGEREAAKYIASCVPGVFGIVDNLDLLTLRRAGGVRAGSGT